jgi:hypothetical protein
MSRAKYLTLMSWASRSPAVRRMMVILPLAIAATTVQAPLTRSAPIGTSFDPPTKKSDPAPNSVAEQQKDPDQISLMHPSPADWPLQSPTDFWDPNGSKPLPPLTVSQPLIPLDPPAQPDTAITVANDPPSQQPLIEPTPTIGGDSGLLSTSSNPPDVGSSGGGVAVGDPAPGVTVTDIGPPPAGTPVPEPTCLWLLPTLAILMRRPQPAFARI